MVFIDLNRIADAQVSGKGNDDAGDQIFDKRARRDTDDLFRCSLNLPRKIFFCCI